MTHSETTAALEALDTPRVWVRVRIPINLHRRLKARASMRGETLNDSLCELLAEAVGGAWSEEDFDALQAEITARRKLRRGGEDKADDGSTSIRA